jgi:hypothetical protein
MSLEEGPDRWRSLGPIELFRYGPWEVIVPFWVAGAVLVAAWLSQPLLRVLGVTEWPAAGLIGGALCATVAARACETIYIDARSLPSRVTVLVAMSLGALGGAAGALTFFAPIFKKASTCAPLVATGESDFGAFASYTIPIVLFVFWCLWLITRFPPMVLREHRSLHGRRSRYADYSEALRRRLPVRLLLTIGWVVLTYYVAMRGPARPSLNAPPEQIVEALRRHPSQAAVQGAPDWTIVARTIDESRVAVARAATAALAALRFDDARPLVAQAACGLVLPGSTAEQRLVEAEAALQTLDAEPANSASLSPSAVEAVVTLLPFSGREGATTPPCPFFQPSQGIEIDAAFAARLPSTNSPVSYRGRQLLDVRVTPIQPLDEGPPATLEVAILVAGATGSEAGLLRIVERRLGVAPSEPPRTIGRGSMCARWDLGTVGIRVGPAVGPKISEAEMNKDSPLWITCFDERLSPALTVTYRREDGGRSWSPHSCGILD